MKLTSRSVRITFTAALLAVTAPLLAACSSPTDTVNNTENASSVVAADTLLTLTEGWAKSADTGGMTGVFGMLQNSGDDDITLVSVESDAAGSVELHEVTADGVMQEIDGDVVVPAGGSFELAPGANHIMLMALQQDLLAGDDVAFTVHYRSGGVEHAADFTVLVKDYAGANEEYGDLDHGAHDHGAHDHDAHDHSSDSADGEGHEAH